MPFAFKFELSCTSVPKLHFYLWHSYALIAFLPLVVILFAWPYKLFCLFFDFYYFEDSFIELHNYFIYNKFAFLLGIYSSLSTFTYTRRCFYWNEFISMYIYIYICIIYCIFFLLMIHLSHPEMIIYVF